MSSNLRDPIIEGPTITYIIGLQAVQIDFERMSEDYFEMMKEHVEGTLDGRDDLKLLDAYETVYRAMLAVGAHDMDEDEFGEGEYVYE